MRARRAPQRPETPARPRPQGAPADAEGGEEAAARGAERAHVGPGVPGGQEGREVAVGQEVAVGVPAKGGEEASRGDGGARVYAPASPSMRAGARGGVPARAGGGVPVARPHAPLVESPRAPARSFADGTEVAARDHRHLAPEELEARRAVVRQLLALGVTSDQLPGAMRDQGWQMSREVGRREYDAVLGEWAADHAHLRETTRVSQVQRLQSDLALYRRDKRWQAVVQTEALLARILGHLAPTKVEVQVEAHVVVREALVEVVAGMTAEDMDRLLAEEAELEQLAAQARGDARALVVHGEPVAVG
jgi:hypothetical protein